MPQDIANLSDRQTVARTIWGEARNQIDEGKIAVANVITNRVYGDIHNDGRDDWWGEGWTGVSRKPWQFSCWNQKDPNLPLMLEVSDDPADEHYSLAFVRCLEIADAAIAGQLGDLTKGATHYFNPAVVLPSWAAGFEKTAQIGAHHFYRDRSVHLGKAPVLTPEPGADGVRPDRTSIGTELTTDAMLDPLPRPGDPPDMARTVKPLDPNLPVSDSPREPSLIEEEHLRESGETAGNPQRAAQRGRQPLRATPLADDPLA